MILLYLKSLKNDHCFVDETHRDCQAGVRETGHAISQCRQILEDLYRTRGLFSYISLIRKLFNLRLLWGKILRKSIFTITFQLIDKWINRFCQLPIFNLMNCLHWAVISPHSICFVVWVPIVESFIKFGSAWGLGGGGCKEKINQTEIYFMCTPITQTVITFYIGVPILIFIHVNA